MLKDITMFEDLVGETNGYYSEEVDFDKVEGELTMLEDNK